MSRIWIVHRRERERAALESLAAAAEAVTGAPDDPRFESAPPPETVVLGLADDWEAELEFAHRQRRRLPTARWILVGEPGAGELARALFDRLALDYLPYPPTGAALRQRIGSSVRADRASLSQRARRDAATERFSRWLSDLELPELLRSMDPRLAEVPLLVRGEAGSGRSALIRYAHQFGPASRSELVGVACEAATNVDSVLRALERGADRPGNETGVWVWLDEIGRLSPRHQRELADWIEAGSPGAPLAVLRWVAGLEARDPELDSDLAALFATLRVELPPLRERADRLEAIAQETAAAWARQRREAARRFGPDALAALRRYPWPGNLRELERVLLDTLAHSSGDPIGARQLRLPGAEAQPAPPAPDAGAVHTPEPETAPETETASEPEPEPIVASQIGVLLPDRPAAEPEPVEASRVGVMLPDSPPSELPASEPQAGKTPAPKTEVSAGVGDPLEPLAQELSGRLGDPRSLLRSFAELAPERFGDPAFRARFAEMLREEGEPLSGLLGRLDRLGSVGAPRREKLDLAALLESLLDSRRDEFRRRHLLVLKELDPGQSAVMGDPQALQVAFEALLDKALAMIPDRGDLYLASRRLTSEGDPAAGSTRVLLRFHDPTAAEHPALSAAEHSLALLIAELLVRAQGGRLTLGTSDAEERLLVADLPAPS